MVEDGGDFDGVEVLGFEIISVNDLMLAKILLQTFGLAAPFLEFLRPSDSRIHGVCLVVSALLTSPRIDFERCVKLLKYSITVGDIVRHGILIFQSRSSEFVHDESMTVVELYVKELGHGPSSFVGRSTAR
jgi:hypothetical protein